jgi:hypothetical protein
VGCKSSPFPLLIDAGICARFIAHASIAYYES